MKKKKLEDGMIAGMPVAEQNVRKIGGYNIGNCPFCGCRTPIIVHRAKSNGRLYKAVECTRANCLARGPFRVTVDEAILGWNKVAKWVLEKTQEN